METLKTLKKRIKSVEDTVKVTSVMKLSAISELRRMQERAVTIKEYHNALKILSLRAAAKEGRIEHPLFLLRKRIKRALVIVISSERGFCGSLCGHLAAQIKPFIEIMRDRKIDPTVWVQGKFGHDKFQKYGIPSEPFKYDIGENPSLEQLSDLTDELINFFINQIYDQIVIIYTGFKSPISTNVVVDMFLPIWVKEKERPEIKNRVDYIFEPSKKETLDRMVRETLRADLLRSVLEGKASELAARMIAMDEATKNGEDIVKSLKGKASRLRQSNITRELLDIIGGAEALRQEEEKGV